MRILYIAVGIIGMILIAHLGKEYLAAGALATTLSTTIIVIAMSPLLAVSIINSRYHGEGKKREVGIIIQQAWILSILLGITSGLLLWFLPNLLTHLGQPNELIPLTRNYFHGLSWGITPSFLVASCNQMFFPIRKGNLVVFWSMMNLILTSLLGFVLIFGYAGFPRLGIGGWAYATSIINWILVIWVGFYLYFCKEFQCYELFNFKNKIDITQLKLFFKISLPITMQFSGEMLAFSMLSIMVGWLGVMELSVQQIIIQCSTLALMIPMGSAQSTAILIGQAMGRNETNKIRKIFFLSLIVVVICMGIIAAVYLTIPKTIIAIYINIYLHTNTNIVQLAILMLSIIAFSQIADAVRNLGIGALRGLHDVWQPMWMNITLLFVFAIPFAYILGFILKYGIVGLNLAFLIAFVLGALLMFWRFMLHTKSISVAEI